eukprot:1994079-Rhodomonas_salina.1
MLVERPTERVERRVERWRLLGKGRPRRGPRVPFPGPTCGRGGAPWPSRCERDQRPFPGARGSESRWRPRGPRGSSRPPEGLSPTGRPRRCGGGPVHRL